MSAMMSAPPPPPSGPPPPPPGGPAGVGPGEVTDHGAFSAQQIQQIMAATGYTYEEVCADIDATGATNEQQLYPQLFSAQGIQPQGQAGGAPPDQTVGPGVVQGQPPAAGPMGAAPPMAPPPEGSPGEESGESPGLEAGEREGIDPRVAQAVHAAVRMPKYKRRK